MSSSKPAKPPRPAPHLFDDADADLVDRIFDYVRDLIPEICDADKLKEAKAAVRAEFKGEKAYVRGRDVDLAQQVLRLFNGRNASEVARELGIGRATVYRLLKQSGVSASRTKS